MLRAEPTLKPGLFRLPDDPVAAKILIPGFRAAKRVQGAFGWFTAGWIDRLAPGLAEYLNRPEAEPITFTVAPVFFPDEREALERGLEMPEDEAVKRIAQVFVSGRTQANALGRHALDCLAWMVAARRLHLRVAVPTSASNYHPKVWLFDDGDHQVIARGSGNATSRGVADGVEHMDVDVSWMPECKERVAKALAMVDDWTHARDFGLKRVCELPQALAEDIIQTAPSSPPQPGEYKQAKKRVRRPPKLFIGAVQRLVIPNELVWKTGPYAHQGEAVSEWEQAKPAERGVIEMATGAGKTKTALICATRAQNRRGSQPFLLVISAPSIPLIAQWRKEVQEFSVRPIAPNLEASTDAALTRLFRALHGGGTHVLIVTNNLLCAPAFQRTLDEKLAAYRTPIATMLIGDEAHTLGADSFIRNKPEFFDMRLALSATPRRQYDPDGTEEIFDFFGQLVYQYGLERAIGFCLAPYNYYVHACTLEDDELEKFEQLTRRIGAAIGGGASEEDEKVLKLLIARRRIIETGFSKIGLLRAVLKRRGPRSLRHALVYASAKNPGQFEEISRVLTELQIKWAPVTQATTAKPKLLDQTLRDFKQGLCQVILAKKVLDEGVDIPSIREAFIVASSTVEREWIQRRGRVLRKHPDKPWALIHDFLCLPPVELVRAERSGSLPRIVQNEMNRAYEFGSHARNVAGSDGVAADLDQIRAAYWPAHGGAVRPRRDVSYWIAASTPGGLPWK